MLDIKHETSVFNLTAPHSHLCLYLNGWSYTGMRGLTVVNQNLGGGGGKDFKMEKSFLRIKKIIKSEGWKN